MNMKWFAHFVIFIANFRLCQCKKSYSNYSLFEITPTSYHHARFLKTLHDQKYIDVTFWRKSVKLHDNVQAMVSQKDQAGFKERLDHFEMKSRVLLPDVQEALEQQIVNAKFNELNWYSYHDPNTLDQWLYEMASKYPNVNVFSIGKTAEGRDILVLDINNKTRPSVIFEAGIHGNEWISVSFITYFIQQLIQARHGKNSDLKKMAKRYHWYFIPVMNPDGFLYTHMEDRLWRKNRRVLDNGSIGVDLNRNFDFSFGQFSTSKNPEDEVYCGPAPFSEPESTALAKFIAKVSKNLKFYFSIHSYGQNIIIPFANTVMHMGNYESMRSKTEHGLSVAVSAQLFIVTLLIFKQMRVKEEEDVEANFAKQGAAKIFSIYGTKYEVGTNYDIFGAKSSGSSTNWLKKQFKTEYVFVLSLRDNGTYGFALPDNQIQESCEEALIGTIEIMKASIKKVMRTQMGTYSVADDAFRTKVNAPLFSILVFHLYSIFYFV